LSATIDTEQQDHHPHRLCVQPACWITPPTEPPLITIAIMNEIAQAQTQERARWTRTRQHHTYLQVQRLQHHPRQRAPRTAKSEQRLNSQSSCVPSKVVHTSSMQRQIGHTTRTISKRM
jgi:hypothetical protein